MQKPETRNQKRRTHAHSDACPTCACECRPTAITCPAITTADSSNATFAESTVSGTVTGTCLAGYTGVATRACTGTSTQPGTWGAVLSSCSRTCDPSSLSFFFLLTGRCELTPCCSLPFPLLAFGRSAVYCNAVDLTGDTELASFPAALAGSTSVGTCADGYYGQPQLTCQSDGTFDLTSLANACNGAWNGTWEGVGISGRSGEWGMAMIGTAQQIGPWPHAKKALHSTVPTIERPFFFPSVILTRRAPFFTLHRHDCLPGPHRRQQCQLAGGQHWHGLWSVRHRLLRLGVALPAAALVLEHRLGRRHRRLRAYV